MNFEFIDNLTDNLNRVWMNRFILWNWLCVHFILAPNNDDNNNKQEALISTENKSKLFWPPRIYIFHSKEKYSPFLSRATVRKASSGRVQPRPLTSLCPCRGPPLARPPGRPRLLLIGSSCSDDLSSPARVKRKCPQAVDLPLLELDRPSTIFFGLGSARAMISLFGWLKIDQCACEAQAGLFVHLGSSRSTRLCLCVASEGGAWPGECRGCLWLLLAQVSG